MVNYIVHINDWQGHRAVPCETEIDAWRAIVSRAFGGHYWVEGIGKADTLQFIIT